MDDCDGVGNTASCSSLSESSSSPMAKAPSSSGTLLRVGVRTTCGLLVLSAAPVCDTRFRPLVFSVSFARSLRR